MPRLLGGFDHFWNREKCTKMYIPDRSAVYMQCSGVYTACTLHVHCKVNSVAAVYTAHAVYYTLF